MHAKSLQLCLTLRPHGLWPVRLLSPWILRARILEYWSGLSCPPPGDMTQAVNLPLAFPALAGRFFTTSTTWEALTYPYVLSMGLI